MLKVSVSGIRGIWGEDLDHAVVLDYVQAFVRYLGKSKKVAIATDTRKTKNIIKNLVISVLESHGYIIYDLGIVPTPLVLYAVKAWGLDGGIMVSASHNPAPWNALKLIDRGGFFFNEAKMGQIQSFYANRDFLGLDIKHLGSLKSAEVMESYLAASREIVDFSLIKKALLKVGADFINGTAGFVMPRLFDELGVNVKAIHTDPERDFERGAEPLPENLKVLGELVVQNQLDVGLAYDPDADRLALVDEKGRAIGEDWTLAIAYLNLQMRHPGDIVVNLSTSMLVDEAARRFSQKVYKAKVGEIHVTEKMLELGIALGGEGNGGVIYLPLNNCRDSLLATMLVLEYLARTGKKISDIVAEFPKIVMIKERIPYREDFDFALMEEKLIEFLRQRGIKIFSIDHQDGLRIDYSQGWIQLRASNTEPIIRIMGENTDPRLQNELRELLENGKTGSSD